MTWTRSRTYTLTSEWAWKILAVPLHPRDILWGFPSGKQFSVIKTKTRRNSNGFSTPSSVSHLSSQTLICVDIKQLAIWFESRPEHISWGFRENQMEELYLIIYHTAFCMAIVNSYFCMQKLIHSLISSKHLS